MSSASTTLRQALAPTLIVLLALLASGYTWWQFAASKDEVERQTREAATLRAAQLADAIEGQVSALLGAMDLGLQQVRAAWLRNPAEAPPIVRTALDTLPAGLVSHLSIVDAEGYIVYSSLAGDKRIYVGDRPHFVAQQSGADRLLIGKPVQARQGQGWHFIVNRPLLREGRFAGVVSFSVRTDAMAALLGRVQLSDRDLVTLLYADGAFLARSLDNTAAMGKAVAADRPFLAADAPELGHFYMPGTLDQVGRIFAWSRLTEVGLITIVGLDEEALLAPLKAERRADQRLTALMSALLVLAGLLLAGFYARMQRQGRQLREDNLRRQQIEAELAQSHAQLEQRVAERTFEVQQQLQRIEALLNTMQDGFFAADITARIRHVNPAYCTLLGFGEAELLAMSIPDVEANENPEETAAHIRKVLASGHDRFETRHGRKDGSVVDVEVSVSLVTIAGDPMFYAFVRDITSRKAGERALRQARDDAERANAAKSDFLSRMSHELRTPLNAILGFAQMLQLPGNQPLSVQQAESVDEIRKGGEHLLDLVNEVLDLARIESGHIELSLGPVPLAPLVDDCLALLRPLAQARGIAMVTELEPAQALLGDYTRIKQVLLNLLSNAIKFNREGGSIRLAAVVDGERLRVEVHDSGRGIASDKLAMLFKPFQRLESSFDGIEGVGIGLALVKRLVEAMEGEVGVHSAVGVGSRFWFTLPAANLPMAHVLPAGAGATGAVRHTLLCIEDNPANLKLLRKLVGKRPDLDMIDAMNAERGLALAFARPPDLILLDINLPGMDGYAVLAQLKAHPATASIPVIAVTANAMPRDIERGRLAGFSGYLTKPIDVSRFFEVLDEYLNGNKEQPV